MFKSLKEYFDFKGAILVLALVIIGLVSVYSATYDARAGIIFQRQLIWAAVGFVLMIGAAFFPLRTLQRVSFPLYGVTLLILLVLLLVGKTISGSRSWFGFGGFGIQPSEFAKVTTVLALAAFLSKSTTTLESMKHLAIAIALVMVPMALVLAQPDMGTAIIFFGLFLPILYWAGAESSVLAFIIAPMIAAAGALFGTTVFVISIAAALALLVFTRRNLFSTAVAFGITIVVGLSTQVVLDRMPAYQQKRIMAFLNPEADPLGSGYNVLQSKVAIGSGGVFGKGFLHGTQTQLNFIPEQWTDFIFCVPGEEFGFVGASIVLLLFGALLFHGIKIASTQKNKFASIAAIGFTGIFALHAVINIGMSMGLMPVVGIPLSFLSYGGSALMANMIMGGLLMNFYGRRKDY